MSWTKSKWIVEQRIVEHPNVPHWNMTLKDLKYFYQLYNLLAWRFVHHSTEQKWWHQLPERSGHFNPNHFAKSHATQRHLVVRILSGSKLWLDQKNWKNRLEKSCWRLHEIILWDHLSEPNLRRRKTKFVDHLFPSSHLDFTNQVTF